MNYLFDQAEKLVKFHRDVSQQLHVKQILNPFNQTFIDESQAEELGILVNGYYRNRYGGLIPLPIAASKGLIQFIINDQIECEEMEIEYRSTQSAFVTHLLVRQVYDAVQQAMIPFRLAIEQGYLDLEVFSYSSAHLSMPIHEAFYRGLILGEIRTTTSSTTAAKPLLPVKEKVECEYDRIFSSLTNIINSLSEFRNTIRIDDQCELTPDGFIRQKSTEKSYLLTEAMELGLVSIEHLPLHTHSVLSQSDCSTMIDESQVLEMESTHVEENPSLEQPTPFFSDTFILDLFKCTNDVTLDIAQEECSLMSMDYRRSLMNKC